MYHPRDRHDTSPFLDNPPPSPWRARAKELSRRPLFTRQVAFVALFLVVAAPLWLLTHHGQDAIRASAAPEDLINFATSTERQIAPVEYVATSATPTISTPPSFNARPHGDVKAPHRQFFPPHMVDTPLEDQVTVVDADPVTFSFIMFSADSASEGAVLMKSILMYSSGPTHFHIICDDDAQAFLEKRLALVKRPKHNVLVRFYKLTRADMTGRIEREGAIFTDHSAGVPGLMKLFIHEILPETVKKSIFIDTDAFFISDPLLLWQQFDKLGPNTAISMPTHPEQEAPHWHHANKICSCIMLLDLEKLRKLRLMDSSAYRNVDDGISPLSPAAFRAMFGPPGAEGHYEDVKLGDQGYWWAIVSHRPDVFEHLSFDWEVSSCLLDMYFTGLGHDDATEEEELAAQLHTWATPHQGQVILPKMLHFNCLDGTPRYFEWEGWSEPDNSLEKRWGAAMRYHVGLKWLWLNQANTNDTKITVETVGNVKFADELMASRIL